MSDWQDRAIPVNPESANSDWKTRAVLAAGSSEEVPGAGEAIARGAEQGATLGFGPTVNGGLETLLDSLTGKNKNLDIIEDYRKHRDASKAAMNAASNAHPWLYGAGTLAGGVVPALATSGLIAPAEGLAGAAQTGALMGGVAGLGNSNADLTKGDLAGAAKDVALGAGTGAILGPVLDKAAEILSPAATQVGNTAKGAATVVGGSKMLKYPTEAFKRGLNGQIVTGQAGEDLANSTALATLGESGANSGSNVWTQLQQLGNVYGAQKLSLLQQAGDLPAQEFGPWVQSAEQAVADADNATSGNNADALGKIGQMIKQTFYNAMPDEDGAIQYEMKPELSFVQLENFKRDLGNLGSAEFANGMKNPTARALVNRLLTPLDEGQEAGINQGGLLGLSDRVMPLTTFMEEHIPGYQPGQVNPLADVNKKLNAVSSAIQSQPSITQSLSVEKGGISSVNAKDKIQSMLNYLKQDPELSDVADAIENKIKDVSSLNSLVHNANLPGLSHGWIADSARGAAITGANWSGRGIKAMYDMTPNTLKQLAVTLPQTVGNSDAVTRLSNILKQAADRDTVGRNALLFAIQQNPEYRQVLHHMMGTDEEPSNIERPNSVSTPGL